MATGDINHVKVLYRQTLGGGFGATGNAANRKVLVVGELKAEYEAAGVNCADLGGDSAFGVTSIDILKLEAVTSNSVYADAEKISLCSYDHTTKRIFYVVDEGQATPAKPTDGHVVVIRFLCIGDDAGAPVLT